MRFLYFVEGLSGCPTRETVVRASGLDYAFPAGEPFVCREMAGALGAGVLAAHGDGQGLAYNPKTHDWSKIRDRVWLGVPRDKAQQPGPGDLARSDRALDGHAVLLADGRNWMVPVIRFLDGNTQLPRVLTKVNGRACWKVEAQFSELVDMANVIISDLLDGEKSTYDPAVMLRFAALAIGVNYRVGEDEVAALGIVNSVNVQTIANAALDGPRLEELIDQKKKVCVQPDRGVILEAGASD